MKNILIRWVTILWLSTLSSSTDEYVKNNYKTSEQLITNLDKNSNDPDNQNLYGRTFFQRQHIEKVLNKYNAIQSISEEKKQKVISLYLEYMSVLGKDHWVEDSTYTWNTENFQEYQKGELERVLQELYITLCEYYLYNDLVNNILLDLNFEEDEIKAL